MSNKYIITKVDNYIFYGMHNGKSFYEVNVCSAENQSRLGNIYIGKVRDVVPSINAAFVEYSEGCIGYYSMESNKNHLFLNRKNSNKIAQGDEIIVQIAKDAIKTKDPVLSSEINLSGKYAAITVGKNGIGISSKINDLEVRDNLKNSLKPYSSDSYGIIVRTNAASANISEVCDELSDLVTKWEEMYQKAQTRTIFTKLFAKKAEYAERINGIYNGEIEELVTDDVEIFNEVSEMFSSCRLYDDKLLPLNKLYNVSGTINELTSKKVWLKCGGYLIIEPTEAMTVIDVNTGKFSKGKNIASTILKVNIEAAEEIARQIRLRNISGIIIIDFINMDKDEDIKQVIDRFDSIVSRDPIKTTVVDMTKLNLLEVTRRKTKPPLHEIIKNI